MPEACGLSWLDDLVANLPDDEPRFCGYAIALPYSLGRLCDDAIPSEIRDAETAGAWHSNSCRAVARRITAAYVLEPATRTAEFQFSREAALEKQRKFIQLLGNASATPPLDRRSQLSFPAAALDALGDFTPQEYMSRVGQIQQHILAGDFYECNFTQRYRMQSAAPPRAVAAHLFATPVARHACYMDFGDRVLISNSPEQFLRVESLHIATSPIKGSIRRSADSSDDQRLRSTLAGSPKDHAEHTMVVDMARNDLGRICTPGTVRVTVPYAIESHPALHHLVSTVEGRLLPETPVSAILEATFPAASITGTPKIAATHAIQRYEASRRGYYTGAIGFLGKGGNLDLNVAIRTIIGTGSATGGYHYEFGAGGAIVADSVPEDEHAECVAKAGPLYAAIQAASS
jgi:para-aminobenzoate synthetase component 1